MRRLEHLGVLDAHAREIADVEETADSPGAPLDVEELRPTQGIPPERVLLVACRHVVGDDVEDDTQPGVAQGPELFLSAELGGEVRRVHDVVAVRRARPRLHRGREIQVADSEVAQVGDELAGASEIEVGQELQPVGAVKGVVGHRS